jgi:hypothetical protein
MHIISFSPNQNYHNVEFRLTRKFFYSFVLNEKWPCSPHPISIHFPLQTFLVQLILLLAIFITMSK